MIFTDIIEDYQYVYDTLISCNNYFSTCNDLLINYISSMSSATSYYFKLTSVNDAVKNNLISKLSDTYQNAYATITKMITLSFPFYGSMSKLENFNFKNDILKEDVNDFLKYGYAVMEATNEIITAQLPGMKSDALLPKLIKPLQNLLHSYYMLINYSSHLHKIDKLLFEAIPEINDNIDKYNIIELHSMKPLTDFSSFAEDIKSLSSFINQFELLMKFNSENAKIYTQRIENGSLRIVWGSHTIELTAISDIIKSICEGIRMFRLTSAEKRAMDENTRSIKIENDKKELAIINSKIKDIAQITNLSPDKPEDIEKLQKLCLPLIRYIYSNPVGTIGEYKYDLNTDLKLIETVFDSH